MINYGKQTIEQLDVEAVTDVMHSDWMTQGPKVTEFENDLAVYCGARFAVAVANGTAALHLANMAMDLKTGDSVVTTPISFLATANSIIFCDAKPIFSDINPATINLDLLKLEQTIKDNPGVKGIIPVHFGGVVADMESISKIAKNRNMWIIEDACHALGGRWVDSHGDQHQVGDCSFSDMTVFSFHPVKQITTGEGGAILTNDENIYNKLLMLRSHGMTKNSDLMEENHGDWYYEMPILGFNYRISDFQCALGSSQLKRNNEWVAQRRRLVSRYDTAFESIPEVQPQLHPDSKNEYSYHLYVVQVKKRKALYDFLKTKGINTQVHYFPIHLQPYYKKKYGYGTDDFPMAEEYYKNALSLPLFPLLKDKEQDYVIQQVKEFYADA
jgi:UDP-4-amino-4,6-dideoxy-N-acetyl-beta-L-altrosamine transaminase